MNMGFINTFQVINFMDYVQIDKQIKTGELQVRKASVQERLDVLNHVLSGQYIEEIKDSQIQIRSGKSRYKIEFYEGFVLLTEIKNLNTKLRSGEQKYYLKQTA